MNDAPTQAAVKARGAAELEAIRASFESDRKAVQATLDATGCAAVGLLEFHTALVHLRHTLEPVRDAILSYEDAVDALYWSRVASPDATQTLLGLLRTYRHRLDGLLFGLPHHFPRIERTRVSRGERTRVSRGERPWVSTAPVLREEP
jgi:hypothetical protein